MTREFRSTSDVIIRATDWDRALDFYGSVLSLPVVHRSEDLIGFDTGDSMLLRCYIRDPFGLVFNIGQARD
jgi:catechol 2,3-dioxygenase-like lactoylglutathione lyase family enzyme